MDDHPNKTCVIQLFGGLQVQIGEEAPHRFANRKAVGLLVLLALAPHRAHSREQLAERLWPNEDPDVTRKRLRQTLAVLRHTLEPGAMPAHTLLKADRASVQLDARAVRTDVAEYENLLKAARRTPEFGARIPLLKRAMALYRGELLEGFSEEWILPDRERLAETHRQALLQLVKLLEGEGELRQATEFGRQAVAADSLNEEAHYDLIRLYARAGRLHDALRQYGELERLLQEQLGVVPSGATRDLREQVLRGDFAPASSSQSPVSPPISPSLRAERQAPLPEPESSVFLAPPPTDSLPLTFTRFLGREREIEEITELFRCGSSPCEAGEESMGFRIETTVAKAGNAPLASSDSGTRLVTLTGTGGSGKTRLAVEAAKRLTAAYSGSVWFVSLADLTDPGRIAEAILETMRVSRLPRMGALNQLVEVLRLPALLVLDNLEQLLDPPGTKAPPVIGGKDGPARPGAGTGACVDVLQSLLERVPALACLATSRQRVGITGEREYAVQSLPVPPVSATPERLPAFTSVQLFLDRARAANAAFRLTTANSGPVAALCRRLEGIPLAIELAAGWAALLTPEQMLEHIVGADQLTSRQRDTPARHRTLAASIEWSFRLLAPEMQRLFAVLSVFRGGWTLSAAAAVALPAGSRTLVSLELLAHLRDRSLIAAEETDGEMRFRMLETLREFAGQQLTPEERDRVRKRHAFYYLQLAEEADRPMGDRQSPTHRTWLDRLERERHNLMAALDWYLAHDGDSSGDDLGDDEGARHETEEGLRLVGALCPFWEERGSLREGCDYALALLDRPGSVSPVIRARALYEASRLADSLSDPATSYRLLEAALILTRRLGDRRWEADILNRLGVVLRDRNAYALSLEMLQQSLALRKDLEDTRGIAVTLADLGNVARDLNQMEQAREYYLESLEICRKFADKRGIAYALKALGVLAQEQGDLPAARQWFQESLTLYREMHSRWGIAYGLNSLGRLACEEGDLKTARSLLSEGMAIRRDIADRWGISQSLEAFAVLNLHLRDFRRSARLMGAAERLHDTILSALPPNERAKLDRCTEQNRTALGEATFTALWADGYALALEQAVLLALEE